MKNQPKWILFYVQLNLNLMNFWTNLSLNRFFISLFWDIRSFRCECAYYSNEGFAMRHLTKLELIRCVFLWLRMDNFNYQLSNDCRFVSWLLRFLSRTIFFNIHQLIRIAIGRGYYTNNCWSQIPDSKSLKTLYLLFR